MSTTSLELIEAQFDNGKSLPMRKTTSKNANTYWTVLNRRKDGSRYDNGYGVNVTSAIVGEKLPKSVSVLGESFSLKSDKTEKGQQRLRAEGSVIVPGVGKKVFSFRITVCEGGIFNVAASVHGERSKGGQRHILDEL